MRMLDDAYAGKFDLIVTREVSRFARNTVDTLIETRKLKKAGVEAYFKEDGIWTFKDEDGELKLTLMATLAQNESKKTSTRVKAGMRISMENGIFYGTGNILGYDRIDKKNMIINEEQTKIVRFIYDSYLNGKGTTYIKDELERRGCLTPNNSKRWNQSYIIRILSNPFYCGTIVYKEEINTSIQKLEDYKSKLEQIAKTPANTLTDRINILKKIISNKLYNDGEKISHGLIRDVVDSIVVENDHFEWKFNFFNDILKLNLEGKKTKVLPKKYQFCLKFVLRV